MFKKGQSGNPAGRPKGTSIGDAIRNLLKEASKKDPSKTNRELIVNILLERTLEGDVQFAKLLFAYAEPAALKIEHSGEVGHNHEIITLTKAELQEELKKRGLPDIFKQMDE